MKKDPRYIETNPETRSELAVPLIYKDNVIGVLDLEHTKRGFFTDDHQRTITTLAAQIAIAIENARLYEQIARQERRLERDLQMARELQFRLLPPLRPKLENLEVLWRQMPKGKGGQEGAQIAFSPDNQYLFLAVGDRQRMTTAQDPDQPVGKILRLTLDGKPAPGNPNYGKTGASTITLIDPPRNTETAKTAKVVSSYTFPAPNLTPAETWASGVRTPYGMAFAPNGELWEVEHGPRGGDELNLIEKGKNYGWPLVSYGQNYNGVPIPSHYTRPDLAKPVIYWVPVIAPGSLMFYRGTQTFPQWNGNGFVSGMASMSLTRLLFDGKGGAKTAERWELGKRIRDVAEAPDGSLWLLEDANPGALIHVTPK